MQYSKWLHLAAGVVLTLVTTIGPTTSDAGESSIVSATPIQSSTQPATRPAGEGFANPLDVMLADPFIYREADTYYLYATGSTSRGTRVQTSKNLIDWQDRGYAFTKSDDTYSQQHFWAPEMFKHGDRYYLHYTASSARKTLRLVLCDADSPTGPFREIKAPWFESEKAVIDGNVFKDDDGKLYLYYVLDISENEDSEIHVRRMDQSLTPAKKATFCIEPSQDWEGGKWNEAPFVMKRDGVYYLMYSSNYFGEPDYSVGYATATNPMGPWTKFEDNPILGPVDGVLGSVSQGVSGPGHNSVIESPDGKEQFIVYHTHQQQTGQGWRRQLAIDRLRFFDNPDGSPARMKADGPTTSLQPMPSGATQWPVAESDEFDGPLDQTQWLIMSESKSNWSIEDGQLRLRTLDGDIAGDRADVRNLFMQYAPAGDFDVTTKLSLQPTAEFEQAFLTIYQDHNRFIKVASVWSKGGPKFEFATDIDGVYDYTLTENPFGEDVILRVTRRGNAYSAYASGDGKTWMTLKENFEFDLIDTKIGLAACSPESEREIEAAFDFFRITRR